jgi:hypothetical protein
MPTRSDLVAFIFAALAAAASHGCSSSAQSCTVDGKVYQLDEMLPKAPGDCNTCYCTDHGLGCTLIDCEARDASTGD